MILGMLALPPGTRPIPGHSLRYTFSRGAHEVVGQAFKVGATGNLFTCQVTGSRGCVDRMEHNKNIWSGQAALLRPFGQ